MPAILTSFSTRLGGLVLADEFFSVSIHKWFFAPIPALGGTLGILEIAYYSSGSNLPSALNSNQSPHLLTDTR
jgi:hypothetical protein